MWCDENLECLNIQDFIGKPFLFPSFLSGLIFYLVVVADIFFSMMPKAELDNYRIMKTLPLAINRLGLKMVHELNSEHLTRIFEHALQVS